MQTIFVETLILGASYAALGYAAAHPGTLIVEETEGTGVEYAGNMRPSDLVDLCLLYTSTAVCYIMDTASADHHIVTSADSNTVLAAALHFCAFNLTAFTVV